MGSERISVGSCPECGGLAQFIHGGEVRHVRLDERSGELKDEIRAALNRASAENASDTADYILADFLLGCLVAFEGAVVRRDNHRNDE